MSITRFRIKFDRVARRWVLHNLVGGGEAFANEITINVPMKMETGGTMRCEGILHADGLLALPDEKTAVIRKATLDRHKPLPKGIMDPHKAMLSWAVSLHPTTGMWVFSRLDKPTVIITAKTAEVGAIGASSSEGAINCKAEMLLNGRTNKARSVENAKDVVLRQLIQFDQTIAVPLIRVETKTPTLGRTEPVFFGKLHSG